MIPTVESPDVYGFTVFCDDIRQELAGKVSLMGVYRGAIFVHADFPATIPRMGFSISLVQRKSTFQQNVALRIFLPGDSDDSPSIEVPISGPLPEVTVGDLPFILMQADIQLNNLLLKAPGEIKVRGLRDGKHYRLGSLSVMQGTIGDAKAASGSKEASSEALPNKP